MPNILYDTLQEELVALLSLDQGVDDYRVKTFLKMAVREVLEEFKDNIGTRTTDLISLTIETDPYSGNDVSRIYLPNDAYIPLQILIQGYEVTPVSSAEFEKIKVSSRGTRGFHGKVVQREDGVTYVETWPTITQTNAVVNLTYRVTSEDVGKIPEHYKNVILYCVAKHWYNFVHTENPIMSSRMEKRYKESVARIRSDFANIEMAQDRPYENEWGNQFAFFIDRNDRHIRSY